MHLTQGPSLATRHVSAFFLTIFINMLRLDVETRAFRQVAHIADSVADNALVACMYIRVRYISIVGFVTFKRWLLTERLLLYSLNHLNPSDFHIQMLPQGGS